MKKNLFLLGLLVCSMATMAQTEKADKPIDPVIFNEG